MRVSWSFYMKFIKRAFANCINFISNDQECMRVSWSFNMKFMKGVSVSFITFISNDQEYIHGHLI